MASLIIFKNFLKINFLSHYTCPVLPDFLVLEFKTLTLECGKGSNKRTHTQIKANTGILSKSAVSGLQMIGPAGAKATAAPLYRRALQDRCSQGPPLSVGLRQLQWCPLEVNSRGSLEVTSRCSLKVSNTQVPDTGIWSESVFSA